MGFGIEEPGFAGALFGGLLGHALSFVAEEVDLGVGEVGGAIAVVLGRAVEVLVFVEESGLFQFVNCFFDHVTFIDDFEGQGAEHAGAEEDTGEEHEEAEDVDVAVGAVRSTLVQQPFANLTLPHAAQAERSDGDGESDALMFAPAKILRTRGDG